MEKPVKDTQGESAETDLTAEVKELLLRIARMEIEACLVGSEAPVPLELPEILKKKRGAFVTLHKKGHLRGCIGYIEARKPLYETVKEMALAAAFHDPRFSPLRKDEMPDILFEISVLSPLQRVHDINDIEVGRHGLYIVKGRYSGLLLPQVAVEYGWDRLTFLQQTCCKAGLPTQAWKETDTSIFIFSADVFSSDEKPGTKAK